MPKAQATPGKTLLSPTDHTLIMIDHQSQMSFATKSIDATLLRNNVALVAKAARELGRHDSHHRCREKLLRSDLRGDSLGVSEGRNHRSYLDEYVGRRAHRQ